MTRALPGGVDRAARVRRAALELVAERGFHGATMGEVARRAGVAAGTIYVHYASKDALVVATYVEVKADLARAAVVGVAASDPPVRRFRAMWRNAYAHLRADPCRARFLRQVDTSPYADTARAAYLAAGQDPLMQAASAPDVAPALVDLPPDLLYDLGFGPAVRLASRFDAAPPPDDAVVARLVESCWRAVTRA